MYVSREAALMKPLETSQSKVIKIDASKVGRMTILIFLFFYETFSCNIVYSTLCVAVFSLFLTSNIIMIQH